MVFKPTDNCLRSSEVLKRTLLRFPALASLALATWAFSSPAPASTRGKPGKSLTDPLLKADVVPAVRTEGTSTVLPSEVSEAQGDSIWGLDCEGPSGDNECLGVEFDGASFYITGGNSGTDPNKVYIFDRNGNYTFSFDQFRSSGWGWRDLAWDGNHLYGSDDDGMVSEFGTDGTDYGDFPGPQIPNRALAYDPATDHFWTANWSSNIYEFDRTGAVSNQYANAYDVYGMAWDTASPGGPWLWVAAQAPDRVYQFSPALGVYTGVSFPATFTAGGSAFSREWDPAYGILFYLAQASPGPDHVIAYEILFAPLDHDVGVDSIHSPALGVAPSIPLTPGAAVRNHGLNTETFDVTCNIDSGVVSVYTSTQTVNSLPSDSTRFLGFTPDWTPGGPGNVYRVCFYTQLPGDEYPGNDTLCRTTITYSYKEDFEATDGNYTADPANGGWQWGVPTSGPGGAHSGTNLWATVLADTYSSNADWTLDSRDFVAVLDSPALEFWHWYDIEPEWDGGNVKLSADGGASWQIIRPVGGYPGTARPSNAGIPDEPCYTGNSGGWRLAHLDLTAITIGQPFHLRWHFGSDISSARAGWYVDDVYGLGFEPAPAGWIDGTVSDLMGGPIQGAIVTVVTAGASDTTDMAGYYCLEVPAAIHDMHVDALGYNSVDTTGIVVSWPDTTRVDFELTHPEILVDPTSFYLELDTGASEDTSLYIINNGNGPLSFEIIDRPAGLGYPHMKTPGPPRSAGPSEPTVFLNSLSRTPPGWEPPASLFPGEIVEQHPAVGDEPTGFEFDEISRCFWQGAWDNNIYKLDTNFVQINQYLEFGSTSMPPMGLAWHNGYLYQANYDEGRLYKIEVWSWTAVDTIYSPGGANLLGVEWIGDRLWLTDDDQFLYECDSSGNMINQYPTDDAVPYGLAYLPLLDTLYLCGWSGGSIYSVDPATGNQYVAFPTPGSAGNRSCSGISHDPRYPAYVWIAHQADRQLYLTDTGNDAVPWLSADPTSGVVAAGEICTVTVSFDAQGFTQDTTLYADLLVLNNSRTPQVLVPCTLVVHYVGVQECPGSSSVPGLYALSRSSPNPMVSSTSISYQLPAKSHISLRMYNVSGQLVRTLRDETLEPGYYGSLWDGKDSSGNPVGAGVYFLRFSADNLALGRAEVFLASRKVVVVR